LKFRKKRATTLTLAEYKHIVKEEEERQSEEIPFSQKSLINKIFHILELPFSLISEYTIPPVEEEKLDKPYIFIFSITTPLAMLILNQCKIAFNSQGGANPLQESDIHSFYPE
jgi:hypothetical protein